jgi:hypothetical protein
MQLSSVFFLILILCNIYTSYNDLKIFSNFCTLYRNCPFWKLNKIYCQIIKMIHIRLKYSFIFRTNECLNERKMLKLE